MPIYDLNFTLVPIYNRKKVKGLLKQSRFLSFSSFVIMKEITTNAAEHEKSTLIQVLINTGKSMQVNQV